MPVMLFVITVLLWYGHNILQKKYVKCNMIFQFTSLSNHYFIKCRVWYVDHIPYYLLATLNGSYIGKLTLALIGSAHHS